MLCVWVLTLLFTFMHTTFADSQDCIFSDTSVILTPANVEYKESCSWWRCKDDTFTGAGCGILCSQNNITEVSKTCAINEYVEACSAPYESACRKCRYSEMLDFQNSEGYLLTPVILASTWTTDILDGSGNFENGKVQQFGQGLRRAVNDPFMPADSAVLFSDVVFLAETEEVRSSANTWLGRGVVSLLFSSPGDPRGLGALDSRAYLQMEAPGASIYRLIPTPGIIMVDPIGVIDTNIHDVTITNYILSYHWSMSYGTGQQNTITVQIFLGGQVPPLNQTNPIESSTHMIPDSGNVFGWQNVHVPLSNIPDVNSAFVLKVETTGNKNIFLDEIQLIPNFVRAGDMETDPAYVDWDIELRTVAPFSGGIRDYSDYTVLASKINSQFVHGSRFLLAQGSNITTMLGTYSITTLHHAFHSVDGSWATLRIWVIPVQDPALYPTASAFRVEYLHDLQLENGNNIQNNEVIMKHTLVTWEWQLFETTFPVSSYEHSFAERIYIVPISGAALAFDNLEVYIESGVCPFECDISKNRVRVNGRCERCTTTEVCAAGFKTIGCFIDALINLPECKACNLMGLGASDISHGSYEHPPTALNGECWFICDEGFWFDEVNRICVACTVKETLYCGTGEYVKTCAARTDTNCAQCTTLSTSNPAVVFAHGNVDRSLITRSENEQCLAVCAPGYFEWLVSEQTEIGAVYNPLCFACTSSICGASGLSGSTRSRIGLQYTSTCTETEDSKCRSCGDEILGLDTTMLVSNGNDIGSFCTLQCTSGNYICEECRFYGLEEHMSDRSRHSVMLDVDYTMTETWKSTPGMPTDLSLWHKSNVQGVNPTGFNNTYRFSGNVMFQTWPYATELKICMTLQDTTVGFVMKPSNGDICSVMVKPYVSAGHYARNQSFSTDIDLFRVFENLTSIITEYNQVESTEPVSTSRLQLIWELSASPPEASITLWSLKLERYEIIDDCCSIAHACVTCDESLKVANSHFVQAAYTTSTELVSIALQCSWECDVHYEDYMNNGTCLFCETPTCDVDEYFADCGTCGKCVNLPNNAVWETGGSIRGDNSSCAFVCNSSHYQTSDESGTVICAACVQQNCSVGNEYLVECTTNQNAFCVSCSVCSIGLYENSSCTLADDRTCLHCEVELPNGGFWSNEIEDECAFECFIPLIKNTLTSTCIMCDPQCEVGTYSLTTCDITTNFTGCRLCSIPPYSVAISSGVLYDKTCDWECLSSYYYDYNTKQCLEFFPVIDNVATICNISSCSHLWGSYQDSVSCECLACSPQRGNSSQVGISAWEIKGTCSWFCLHPYMRQDNHCYKLDDLTAKEQNPTTKPTSSTLTQTPLPVTSSSVMLIVTISVVPLLIMIAVVSIKVAL
jgi:hypothetical protein